MRFELLVRSLDVVPRVPAQSYDEQVADVNTMLIDLCHSFAESDNLTFLVSGFGQPTWPVEVRPDLSVFLEQLPQLIMAIDQETPEFVLDFYEQGLERRLYFCRAAGSTFQVRVESDTDWQPNPREETIAANELRNMLSGVRDVFARTVQHAAPEAYSHPWFRSWLAQSGGSRTGP